MFVLIETSDVEIVGVHLKDNQNEANVLFNAIAKENGVVDEEDLTKEISGTLRLAGDDSYAVQMIER